MAATMEVTAATPEDSWVTVECGECAKKHKLEEWELQKWGDWCPACWDIYRHEKRRKRRERWHGDGGDDAERQGDDDLSPLEFCRGMCWITVGIGLMFAVHSAEIG